MNTVAATPVIFRVFPDGDVIALFPTIPASASGFDIESYQHMGQHGAASMSLILHTRLATPAEYAPIKRELEKLGYTLKVCKRHTRHMRAAFCANRVCDEYECNENGDSLEEVSDVF